MVTIKAILILIIVFGVLVGIHEFGHFLMAKIFGVWVQEFAFGFGPTIFSKKYKDTIYKINLIPLGGYVKLYGEQNSILEENPEVSKNETEKLEKLVSQKKLYLVPEDELESKIEKSFSDLKQEEKNALFILSINNEKRQSDERRYVNKPIYARLFIVLGGVVMNFLLGFVTFVIYLLISGTYVVIPNITKYNFIGANQESITVPVIHSVLNKENEDIVNSLIIEVNGKTLKSENDFVEILKNQWNMPLKIKYFKDGRFFEGQFNFPGEYDTYYSPGLVNRVVIWDPLKQSPAELAGIKQLDAVIEINGVNISNENDFLTQLKLNKGKEVQFKLFREGEGLIEKKVVLNNTTNDKDPILGANYSIGLPSGIDVYLLHYSNSFTGGFLHSINLIGYQVVGIESMIKQSFIKKDLSIIGDNVGGPIRIGSEVVSLVKANNLYDLINLFGLISLTLAFMNILPLPIVDGGHVVLLGLEKIRKRPLSERSQKIFNLIGLIFIIGLSVIITIKDILQFFK